MSVRFLRPDQTEFVRNAGGLLDVVVDGEAIEDVQCLQLFPLSEPAGWVSIVKPAKCGPEEIGIVESLAQLADDQRRLVEEELALRYFVPEIERVLRIRRAAGMHEVDVVTTRGRHTIFVLNPRENTSVSDSGVVVITDVEGCRYKITRLDSLPAGSLAELERWLL